MKGQANPAHIRENMSWVYKDIYQHIEQRLPPIFKFKENETVTIKQKISQNPLMVCTCLIEDNEGNITPQTKNQNYI
ncbi:MAG: hypothetical protein M3405_16545 [Acidobacteriota bacterium]|jgi:hypothetical protein|nr:hypothetical protein [Acidobacteriota bacterium]